MWDEYLKLIKEPPCLCAWVRGEKGEGSVCKGVGSGSEL